MSLIFAGQRLAERQLSVEDSADDENERDRPSSAWLRDDDDADDKKIKDKRPKHKPGGRRRASSETNLAVQSLQSVAARVPSETIALYLAVLPFVLGSERTGQVLLSIGLAIATPIIELVSFAERKSRAGQPVFDGFASIPWTDLGIALVAFLVWLAAVPNSVLGALPWYRPQLGTVALIVVAFLFALLDRVREISWRGPVR